MFLKAEEALRATNQRREDMQTEALEFVGSAIRDAINSGRYRTSVELRDFNTARDVKHILCREGYRTQQRGTQISVSWYRA